MWFWSKISWFSLLRVQNSLAVLGPDCLDESKSAYVLWEHKLCAPPAYKGSGHGAGVNLVCSKTLKWIEDQNCVLSTSCLMPLNHCHWASLVVPWGSPTLPMAQDPISASQGPSSATAAPQSQTHPQARGPPQGGAQFRGCLGAPGCPTPGVVE